MTDYKALYEQQLAENKILTFQVDAFEKQATEFCLKNGELKEENKHLQEEIEELKEEVEERTTYAVLPAEGQFIDENKKLKEEIECLEISLTIVKEENETNKKNLRKFMEENKKLKKFCKRGRVAEKNSELEEMYLREAGLMYDDDELCVVSQ